MIDEKKLIKFIEKEANKYTMYCDEDKRQAIIGITDSYIELIKSFPEKKGKKINPRDVVFFCLLIGGLMFINTILYDIISYNDAGIFASIFVMIGASLIFIAIVIYMYYLD